MDDLILNIEDLQKELNRAIKDLAAADNLDDRVKLSEVIKNLSESTGVFFHLASEMLVHDLEFDEDSDQSQY